MIFKVYIYDLACNRGFFNKQTLSVTSVRYIVHWAAVAEESMLCLMPAKALQCPQKKRNLSFRDYNSTTKMKHARLSRTQKVFQTPRHAEGIKIWVSQANKNDWAQQI